MNILLRIILTCILFSLPLFTTFLSLGKMDYDDCLDYKDQKKSVKTLIILTIIFGFILMLSVFAIPLYYIWK